MVNLGFKAQLRRQGCLVPPATLELPSGSEKILDFNADEATEATKLLGPPVATKRQWGTRISRLMTPLGLSRATWGYLG